MKIVSIGYHCCIRMIKQATALSDHEVHGIGFGKPMALSCFKTFSLCGDKDQFRAALRHHKDADIFHVHNEPNWLVVVVKEVYPNAKVILDMHDSMAYRTDDLSHVKSPMENVAVNLAEGLVFVSESCKKITTDIYGRKASCVLPSYVNDQMFTTSECNWVGGVVYEGLTATDKTRKVMQYANYSKLAKEFKDKGIPFHLVSPSKESNYKEYYKDAIIENALPYDALIKSLNQYDWGLVGNIDHYKDWQVAMPNKLFEYIAAGLPVVSFNAKECSGFLKETGFGITVKSVDELKKRWAEKDECQKRIYLNRSKYTMERSIWKLEKLYELVQTKGNGHVKRSRKDSGVLRSAQHTKRKPRGRKVPDHQEVNEGAFKRTEDAGGGVRHFSVR